MLHRTTVGTAVHFGYSRDTTVHIRATSVGDHALQIWQSAAETRPILSVSPLRYTVKCNMNYCVGFVKKGGLIISCVHSIVWPNSRGRIEAQRGDKRSGASCRQRDEHENKWMLRDARYAVEQAVISYFAIAYYIERALGDVYDFFSSRLGW